jgi:hypothetical protein
MTGPSRSRGQKPLQNALRPVADRAGRLLHALAKGRNTTSEHAVSRLTWAKYLANR